MQINASKTKEIIGPLAHTSTPPLTVSCGAIERVHLFTARCVCISTVYAVTWCPSVRQVRELRRNERYLNFFHPVVAKPF